MSAWTIEFEEKSGNAHVYGPRPDGNVRPSDGLGFLFRVRCATLATENVAMFPDVDPYLARVARKAAAADDMYALVRLFAEYAATAPGFHYPLGSLQKLHQIIDRVENRDG